MIPTTGHPCPYGLAHLITRIGSGDATAHARLYDRIGPVVFAAARQAGPSRRGDPTRTADEEERDTGRGWSSTSPDGLTTEAESEAATATLAVFATIWRRAPRFDPAADEALPWLADCLRTAVDIDQVWQGDLPVAT